MVTDVSRAARRDRRTIGDDRRRRFRRATTRSSAPILAARYRAHDDCSSGSAAMQRLSRTLIHLNVVTREHHAAADAPWLRLMVEGVDKQAYVAHLVRAYGFEAPLEAAFRYTPGLANLIDLRAHTRAGLIVQDLMRLGLAPGRLAHLDQRFAIFTSAAEALGWMYVAERATLLYGAVRRHLAQHIPEVAAALTYLSAFDEVAAARWSELGDALDALAHAPGVKNQLIRAARQGFAAVCEWYQDGIALRPVGT